MKEKGAPPWGRGRTSWRICALGDPSPQPTRYQWLVDSNSCFDFSVQFIPKSGHISFMLVSQGCFLLGSKAELTCLLELSSLSLGMGQARACRQRKFFQTWKMTRVCHCPGEWSTSQKSTRCAGRLKVSSLRKDPLVWA